MASRDFRNESQEVPMTFRPPRVLEMCRNGDYSRFLCLMEIEYGKIYGSAFLITAEEEAKGDRSVVYATKVEQAWRTVRERAEAGVPAKPGSSWEDFL